ncbi:LLM class flavin-dependent oxidoreductase [Streptomyces sp. NPDC049906]|uniref:LLM class flavin-dependent oxidoreductase n=1 Tax=Streptomyces sp. NPDC049906 TaxID=3155656 RepID=UPI00342BCAF0
MPLERPPYFGLDANVPFPQSAALSERVLVAEEAGFDLFSLMDHPYAGDHHEAYAALGFALGRTRRISGYVGVTNLPLRPAPVLARTVATLSALSGGRFVLGLGSGGIWKRIAAFGAQTLAPKDAVSAFEEAIVLIRLLTGGGAGPVDFDGRFYRVSGVLPAPVPTPPIWTGSNGPRALAITGRLADGWIPSFGADWLAESYRAARPRIDRAAREAGRDPAEVISYFNFGGVLTDRDALSPRDPEGRWTGGSVRQWVEELTGAVLEHGAGGFNTHVVDASGDDGADVVRRFAAEVVPAVRAAVAAG